MKMIHKTYESLNKVLNNDLSGINIAELFRFGLVNKVSYTQYVISEKGLILMQEYERK